MQGMEYYQTPTSRGAQGGAGGVSAAHQQIQYPHGQPQQHGGHVGSAGAGTGTGGQAGYYSSTVNSNNSMYFQAMSTGHSAPPPPPQASSQAHGHYGTPQGGSHHTQSQAAAQQHYGIQQPSGQPSWDGSLSSHHQQPHSGHHSNLAGGISSQRGSSRTQGMSSGNGSAAYGQDTGYSTYSGGSYNAGMGARGAAMGGSGGNGGLGDHHQPHHSMPSAAPSHHGHAGFQMGTYGSSTSHGHVQPAAHHLQPASHHNPGMPPGGPAAAAVAAMRPPGGMFVAQELPLRMVVEAKYVGAIIGQGGSSIREITRESRARCVVDVQRQARDVPQMAGINSATGQPTAEKVISILGQPENCSRACVKILEVIQREQEKDAPPDRPPQEVELKMRAANQLVGRLIGKQGATIKRIMQETGAVVFVSNEPQAREMGLMPGALYGGDFGATGPLGGERTITVKGKTIDIVSAAEQKISQKLRLSYETDMQSRALYPAPGPIGLAPGITLPVGIPEQFAALNLSAAAAAQGRGAFPIPPAVAAQMAAAGGGGSGQQTPKTVKLWVPNAMVGAIIGSKGAHIRNIMRVTGAHIRIEGNGEKKRQAAATAAAEDEAKEDTAELNKEEEAPESHKEERLSGEEEKAAEKEESSKKPVTKTPKPNEAGEVEERLVTIQGFDNQLYRAQYCIYARVAEQSQCFFDEVKLRTELTVPSKLVGRIIGKGGQNVRELQRITGAQVGTVKAGEEGAVDGEDSANPDDTTAVRITGNFNAAQAVQCRVSQLLAEYYARHAQRPSPPAIGASSSGAAPEKTVSTAAPAGTSVVAQASPTDAGDEGAGATATATSPSPPAGAEAEQL